MRPQGNQAAKQKLAEFKEQMKKTLNMPGSPEIHLQSKDDSTLLRQEHNESLLQNPWEQNHLASLTPNLGNLPQQVST